MRLLRRERLRWVVEDENQRLRKKTQKAANNQNRLVRTVKQHPVVSSAATLAAVCLLSVLARFRKLSFASELAPTDSANAMHVAWQVHGTFVAIAFAGLAILFQTSSSEQVLSADRLRSVLFRSTHFPFVLAFSIGGAIELGIVANWFPSDGGLLIQTLGVVSASMILIAISYWQAVKALTQSDYASHKATEAFIEAMQDSMASSHAAVSANSRLEKVLDRSIKPQIEGDERGLVRCDKPSILQDIDLAAIEDMTKGLRVPTERASRVDNNTPSQSPPESLAQPKLRITPTIGGRVRSEQYVFFMVNASAYKGNWVTLESRLSRAIRLESA